MAIKPLELDERWFEVIARTDYAAIVKHRPTNKLSAWKLVWWPSFRLIENAADAWNEYLQWQGNDQKIIPFDLKENSSAVIIARSEHAVLVQFPDKRYLVFHLRFKGTADGYGPNYDDQVAWQHYLEALASN